MFHIIYSLYAIAAGSLSLLAALLIFNITGVNTVANRWLGASYLFLAFALYQLFLAKTGLADKFPIFVLTLELTRWALAPCFYLAIVNLVDPTKKSLKVLANFIPTLVFLIVCFLLIIPRFFDPNRLFKLPAYIGFIFRYVLISQIIVYWILSFRLMVIHSRNIRLMSSAIENIDLKWIRKLLLGILILTTIKIASYNNEISLINPILYCAGIFYIAFFSLKQGIIYPITVVKLPDTGTVLDKDKERLTPDQVNALKSKVTAIIQEKLLFLNPSLTLTDLSREVGIGIHELSYVINTGLNKNFYNLINGMRVDEAKRILLSEKMKHSDLMGVAIEAGFNSKTTFYTTFKKLTGKTPINFIKSNSNSAI